MRAKHQGPAGRFLVCSKPCGGSRIAYGRKCIFVRLGASSTLHAFAFCVCAAGRFQVLLPPWTWAPSSPLLFLLPLFHCDIFLPTAPGTHPHSFPHLCPLQPKQVLMAWPPRSHSFPVLLPPLSGTISSCQANCGCFLPGLFWTWVKSTASTHHGQNKLLSFQRGN